MNPVVEYAMLRDTTEKSKFWFRRQIYNIIFIVL